MKKCSLKHLFIYINSAVIIPVVILFGYWYFIDGVFVNIPIIEKTDAVRLRTDKISYNRGETVSIYNSFCKNVDVPVVLNVAFVDGEVISMSSESRHMPPGCYGIDKPYLVAITKVPEGIYPGVWHLEYTASLAINPIKTVTYYRSTVDFTVIGP